MHLWYDLCCDWSPEAFRPLTCLRLFIIGIGVYSNAVYTKDGWTITAIRETIMTLCPELKPNSFVIFKFCFSFQCHCTLFCQDWKWVPKYKWYFQCQSQISQANLGVRSFLDLTSVSSEYNLSNSCCLVQLTQSASPVRFAHHCFIWDKMLFIEQISIPRGMCADDYLQMKYWNKMPCSGYSSKGVVTVQLWPPSC